jgi:mannonate dehydratase
MEIAMLVNPFTDRNLQLAAQVGVTEVVVNYPGLELSTLVDQKRRVEAFGMRMTVIERKLPHLKIVHNLDGRDTQVENIRILLQNMAETGMKVLCYNWMPDEDWQRTSIDQAERGGARVTAFDLSKIGNSNLTDAEGQPDSFTPASRLWDNLEHFLNDILPTAEDCGIKLALHPDDPPLTHLRGQDRIITSNQSLERVITIAPSPNNGICYCQGALAPAGEDVQSGIRKLAPHIHFAHFRNVSGTKDNFRETFHDNGDLDMATLMRTYMEVGFKGPIRPDHAPSMAGETNETPGYEVLGKLHAVGYMKGLIDGVGRLTFS